MLENLGSVGQRDAKLPAIKVWEWFDFAGVRTRADWFECGRGRMADFFMRPPTLTTGNFEAVWHKDFKFWALKDLNLFKKYTKYQEASCILESTYNRKHRVHTYGKTHSCKMYTYALILKQEKVERTNQHRFRFDLLGQLGYAS